MAVVVDTKVVPPEDRFDLWAERSARVFEPMAVTCAHHHGFRGIATAHGLGPLSVFRVTADASAIHRTPALIAASDPQWLQLSLQIRGRLRVDQDGRSVVIGPGDLVTWESSRPYTVEGLTPFELLNVYCPEHLLRPHTDLLYARTASPLPLSGIVRSLVTEVARGLQDGTISESDVTVAEALLTLVRGLHTGTVATEASPPEVLRGQIRTYIAEHVGDRALSADAVARAHFISRSYLDRLFEDEPRTVSETIRDTRLERCRRDLADPRLADRTILDIAMSWGFTSAAHFSRAFRARYGMAPRDVRGETVKQV